jgi:hypothetical protein
MQNIRVSTVLLAIVLILAACRGGSSGPDDVAVDLAVTPHPPCVGPATIVTNLQDPGGEPVAGAQVSLEGDMNHAGMVPVLGEATEVAPGRYETPLTFSMGGDWFILVHATLPDGRTLEHKVDVPGVEGACGTLSP